MNFVTSLEAAWARNDSLLCVGLDPDPAKFPARLRGRGEAILEFCKSIVDATADLVCAFKPQIAYFAANRARLRVMVTPRRTQAAPAACTRPKVSPRRK